MFASHFARAKETKLKKSTTAKADSQTEQSAKRKSTSKKKDKKAQTSTSTGTANTVTSQPKSTTPSVGSLKHSKKKKRNDSSQNQPRKRQRRHEQRAPRRVRPSPQALELSRQLQDLSRQKRLRELNELYWKEENKTIRDNHHACIVVDCCSKCGNVSSAEEVVKSMSQDAVTVETNTALLKCYAHAGDLYKAMKLFRQMCSSKYKQQKPNVRTLNTLLRGCLWTASMDVIVQGKTHVVGGVVSSEEAWKLYQGLVREGQVSAVDTSSYEVSIILLCQALRIEQAQARIEQLQTQYDIKCKGKASIKGGDQSSLETCGVAYLSLARALALLGRSEDLWMACQRCLHTIQASLLKLEQGESKESTDQGGKRGWKVDASEEGQKRAASNLAYRRHRLTEVENEARALLKRRNSAEALSTETLSERLQTKLLYFAGGGTVNTSSMRGGKRDTSSAAWQSFGLERLTDKLNSSKKSETKNRIPLANDGLVDIAKIFGSSARGNPTDIEIGSGFGDWIVRQAMAFPNRNHFAVELRADRVYQIFTRGTLTTAKALENLCTVGGDSGSFLRDRIGKRTITSVFANHPEPPTQVFGQNLFDLEGVMAGETEPVHMLNSATLGWATDALIEGGRIVVVTDNRNYGNLVCATFVRLMRQRKGALRCLEASQAKKMKLSQVEKFPEDVALFEGQPSLLIGHARDEMLVGQSYFDRLWKSGAGSHSDMIRRYIVVMYKR